MRSSASSSTGSICHHGQWAQLLGVLSPEAIAALQVALDRLQTQADHLAATCALPKAGRQRGRARP